MPGSVPKPSDAETLENVGIKRKVECLNICHNEMV